MNTINSIDILSVAEFYNLYLMTLEGTNEDIRHAEPVLNRCGIQEWRVFDIPTN